MTWWVVVNPTAGTREDWESRVRRLLAGLSLEAEVRVSESAETFFDAEAGKEYLLDAVAVETSNPFLLGTWVPKVVESKPMAMSFSLFGSTGPSSVLAKRR